MSHEMNHKPLVRWTVGPSGSPYDDFILRRSICNFRRIYGGLFDYVVCFNGRTRSELDGLDVDLIEQKPVEGMPEPHGVAWKLYPPRLRPEAHELFMDHDVVLVQRITQIDRFLSLPDAFIYSESPPDSRNYGKFDRAVREGFRLNSGLFGVPPGFQFDFSEVGSWQGYFDEQGFVAASLCHKPRAIPISIEDLWICESEEIPEAKGYHFVHERRGESWLWFLKSSRSCTHIA